MRFRTASDNRLIRFNSAGSAAGFGIEADLSWSNIGDTNDHGQLNNADVPSAVSIPLDQLGSESHSSEPMKEANGTVVRGNGGAALWAAPTSTSRW